MQVNNNSSLVEYSITPQEQLIGRQLSYLQKGVIQNERLLVIHELVQLKPDDMTLDGQQTYWQREAYLRGQLDTLTHLITLSDEAESELNQDEPQE